MPQLDVYILYQLIQNVLILWILLFLLNLYSFLFNIFLSLNVIKLKFFVEKQLLQKIFKEIFWKKNMKYLKKIFFLNINIKINIKDKIFFENLLDIYSFHIKVYNKILKNKYKKNIIISKNNLESYRY